jgi:hypothetical protein
MYRHSFALIILLFLLASAAGCFADPYHDYGTVFITGTITDVWNQQTCDQYNCHIGSTWNLEMTFLAPNWDAPDSHYEFDAVMLGCIGGPPCFVGYYAYSDFKWAPYLYDGLYVDIENGKVVDARVATGGYFIEWGKADVWDYEPGFGGTTTGYAVAAPEPGTIILLTSGALLSGIRRISLVRRDLRGNKTIDNVSRTVRI